MSQFSRKVRATAVPALVQPLEARQLMAVDLSITALSTTLAPSLSAGAKITKTPSASITVANTGDTTLTKKSKGSATLTVTLHPAAGGADVVLGTAKVNANKLVKPVTTKINFSKLKTAPAAAGDYDIVATINGAALGDANAANDSFSKTFAVSGGSDGGGGGTTTGAALSAIGYGNKLTFKKQQGINHGGVGFEKGTYKDDAGHGGTYYLPSSGTGIALLGLTDKATGPKALITIHASFLPAVGGKTLTFSTNAAGSKGSIELAGQTLYFK